MAQREVLLATPFRHGTMGSLGNARLMLLSQHDFPHTFDPEAGDAVVSADHDRLISWHGHVHWANCLGRHCHAERHGFEEWLTNGKAEHLLGFVVDVLKMNPAERAKNWTGFRILGTVNVSNGYPVYSLQAFCRGENSATVGYSGPLAPNVQSAGRLAARGPYGEVWNA